MEEGNLVNDKIEEVISSYLEGNAVEHASSTENVWSPLQYQ